MKYKVGDKVWSKLHNKTYTVIYVNEVEVCYGLRYGEDKGSTNWQYETSLGRTNRQWLESLTDEQMAKVFVVQRFRKCTCCIYEDSIDCTENDCRQGYMQWLQAEHKE